MIVGRLGGTRPVQSFAHFPGALGLAIDGDRLAFATRSEVSVLSNILSLARAKPGTANVYDGYFVPRQSYVVGDCAFHDMQLDGRE